MKGCAKGVKNARPPLSALSSPSFGRASQRSDSDRFRETAAVFSAAHRLRRCLVPPVLLLRYHAPKKVSPMLSRALQASNRLWTLAEGQSPVQSIPVPNWAALSTGGSSPIASITFRWSSHACPVSPFPLSLQHDDSMIQTLR